MSGSKYAGIGMMGDTHGIILQNNTVSGTTVGAVTLGIDLVDIADGLSLFDGASASIKDNVVSENGRFGIALDGADGAQTELSGNTITHNDEYGIILQNQAVEPDVTANDFDGNGVGDTTSGTDLYGMNKSEFAAPGG